MQPTCNECNCFQKENPEPVSYDKYENPIYNGICKCHGYYIQSNEETCIDYHKR